MLTRRTLIKGTSAAIIAGAAPRAAWGRTEADVIIIGAGLAGLNAAHKLTAAGHKCVLLEGEQRVGGRLHTLDDLPGAPDAGGIQVGSGYTRLRAIADELNVAFNEGAGYGVGAGESPSALFHIGGQTLTAADWPTASANQLPEAERAMLPNTSGFALGSKLPRLSAPEAWMTADPALDISVAEAMTRAGVSAEAQRLMQANFNGNTLASMSQLSLSRAAAIFRAGAGPVYTIKGGSQRLTDAMGRRLKTPARLGQVVTSIVEDAGGVTVTANGRAMHARHVLCTIPFAALRHIKLEGAIGPELAHMIAALPYTRASFAYISASEPFWKSDGMPETLWSDDPWLGRVFVLNDSMLKLWTRGEGADLLDRATPEQAGAEIIRRLEAARPSAKGNLKIARLFSWQKSPFARGIYHHIGTGQAATLAAATQSTGSRILFAGEHMAQATSGMEAALESSDRCVAALVR